MNDKQKIRFLEQQVQRLQTALDERNKPREAIMQRITYGEMQQGFMYPVDTIHAFIDWRDYSLCVIRPKPAEQSETVKRAESKQGT